MEMIICQKNDLEVVFMFASDQSVCERTGVGWQIRIDGSEYHNAGSRRFIFKDVTQRPTGLEEGAIVIDIVDKDMYLVLE